MASLIALLKTLNVPYETYFSGAGFIHFLLGPATVALAVPLYEQRRNLANHAPIWFQIAFANPNPRPIITLSTTTETILSMVPKSVTTPIAMGISENIGGMPDLTAALVVITGILGSIIGRPFFNILKIRSEPVVGVSLGIAAHGMGTGAAFQISNRAGAFGGLGMGLCGIISAFLAPLLAGPLMRLLGL